MHLLVCTIPTEIPKYKIEAVVNKYDFIRHISWILAENGSEKRESMNPMIGGMVMNGCMYEEENMMMIKLKGKDNARKILQEIKNIFGEGSSLDQYIIPIMV